MAFPCASVWKNVAAVVARCGNGLPLAACLLGVSLISSSARAQSGSPVIPSLSPQSSTIDLVMPEIVRGSTGVEEQAANAVVDGKLQGLVDDLLRRSTAFRRQWQRLTRVPRLSVRIELVHAHRVLNAHAAAEVTVRPDGSLLAVIAIPGGTRLAELIAHEVEHVLERLDGVKVASRHALGDGSVRRASGAFETARAVLVGQMVAREYQLR